MKKFSAAIWGKCLLVGAMAAQAGSAQARAPDSRPAQKKTGAPARASLLNPGSLKAKAPDSYKVKFTTTKGVIVVQVTRAWAPLGADRFYNLARNGFYDGASFFRVLPGFVAQFGISARPEVSRVWERAAFRDDPVTQSNKRGTVTFATAGPNSRTSQVFINLADNTRLDTMGFSPFGEVTEGMDIVDKFYSSYGEGAPQGAGPDQSRIAREGKTYLEKHFPLLDSIKATDVVSPQSPGPSKSARPGKEQD